MINRGANDVAWSPNGKLIAVSSGWSTAIVDSSSYELKQKFSHHKHKKAWPIAFSPDSRFLANALLPDDINRNPVEIRVWRVQNESPSKTSQQNTSQPNDPIAERAKSSASTDTNSKGEQVYLFNGRDLNGWQVHGHSGWTVDGNSLVGQPNQGPAHKNGWLMHDEVFGDFELVFDYRLAREGNSGVLISTGPESNVMRDAFQEVQLLDNNASKYAKIQDNWANGSLYGKIAASRLDADPRSGTWNEMKIRVVEETIQVWVNRQQVLDGAFDRVGNKGNRIAFQLHTGKVEFRHIKLTRLD